MRALECIAYCPGCLPLSRSQSMRDEAVGRFVPTGRSLCHGPAFEDVAVLTLAAFNGERGERDALRYDLG
eukprot:6208036-Pleurochrysis_carterae.AAC.4